MKIMRKSVILSTAIAMISPSILLWEAPLAASANISTDLEGFVGIWEIARREDRRNQRRGSGARTGRADGGERSPPQRFIPNAEGPDGVGPNVEGLDRGDLRIYGVMTPAGRAVFDAMDPRDLPANNCLSNGLPSLVGIPDVQEWSVEGEVLTIHYANFNAVRSIYLDGRAATGGASHFGHSTGEFSGGEFVVTTNGLAAILGGLARNAPGSASRSYVERYSLSEDGMKITGMLTIHDPEYLTQDLRRPIEFSRAAEGIYVPEIGCSVEASQRYLD